METTEVLRQAPPCQRRGAPNKTILISGSSGFIGTALSHFLSDAGHTVIHLVRRPPTAPNERRWNPDNDLIDPAVFTNVDVVIHLGGENLLAHRWSKKFKQRFVESRVKTSELLCRTIAELAKKPELVIVASAVGFYGDTGIACVDENSPPGRGFLADTCRAWESSACEALHSTTRLIHLRMGMVLGASGGALKKILPIFKLGLGGVLGDGSQVISWIALRDLFAIVEHAIYTPALHGALNAVSPQPVTNRVFTKTLGDVLKRPTIIPTPAPLLRLIFGEVADPLLLASTCAVPKALLASGYTFLFPALPDAIQAILEEKQA